MLGSMCLTQRWSIHLPAPCSILGPRVQYKHQRELLWCFCLLQRDSHVCIPVEGSDLFSLLKPIPCHRHHQCFVASVRWSSSNWNYFVSLPWPPCARACMLSPRLYSSLQSRSRPTKGNGKGHGSTSLTAKLSLGRRYVNLSGDWGFGSQV